MPMFTCLLATSVMVGAPALKEVRKPAKPPTGVWKLEECRDDGVTIEVRNSRLRINQKSLVWEVVLTEQEGSAEWFVANGTTQVDIVFASSGTTIRGIWRTIGDELTICTGPDGGDRPDAFDAPKGSGQSLWKLSRIGD